MQDYEITYLANPRLNEAEKQQLDEVVDKEIQDRKGEIGYTSPTGAPGSRRRLHFPIKEQRVAWLRVVQTKLRPGKIEALRQVLSKQKDILRVSILRTARREEVLASIFEQPAKIEGQPRVEKNAREPEKKVTMKEVEEKIEQALEEEVK